MPKFNVVSSTQIATRNMKIIHWGGTGKRKTEAVLRNYPDVFMIDVEGNGSQCIGMKEIPEFLHYPSVDVYEISDLLDAVTAGQIKFPDGRKPQTVFIDGMSILWEVRKEVASDKAEARVNRYKSGSQLVSADDTDISMREWNIAKRPLKALSTSLANLPIPFIVMSTREKAMTVPRPGSTRADDVITVGWEMDAMKGLAYEANLVLRMFSDDTIEGAKLIKGPWKCEVTKVQGALGATMPEGKQFSVYPIKEIMAHAKNIKPSVGNAKTEMAVAKEQAIRDDGVTPPAVKAPVPAATPAAAPAAPKPAAAAAPAPAPAPLSAPVSAEPVAAVNPFAQKDLIEYAKSRNVAPADLSKALRANPETCPDNWDPAKEAQYKAVVDSLVK